MKDKTISIEGRPLDVSSLDKVLFAGAGLTKGDLIDYYHRIAPVMLPHLMGRPLVLRRFPDGINAPGFYQQEAPAYFPDWIARAAVLQRGGGTIVHAVCNNAATLVYLANQYTITPHAWASRADRPDQPDQLIVDLDPSGNDLAPVRRAARAVRDALEGHGLTPFLMTTGSRGYHVRAPLRREHTFDTVRTFARTLAEDLAGRHPHALTTEQRKKKRARRLYLDVLRNAYGQTAVPPYAVRALPRAPVATPLDWYELGRTTPDQYTVRNIFKRLGQKADPWANMSAHAAHLRL